MDLLSILKKKQFLYQQKSVLRDVKDPEDLVQDSNDKDDDVFQIKEPSHNLIATKNSQLSQKKNKDKAERKILILGKQEKNSNKIRVDLHAYNKSSKITSKKRKEPDEDNILNIDNKLKKIKAKDIIKKRKKKVNKNISEKMKGSKRKKINTPTEAANSRIPLIEGTTGLPPRFHTTNTSHDAEDLSQITHQTRHYIHTNSDEEEMSDEEHFEVANPNSMNTVNINTAEATQHTFNNNNSNNPNNGRTARNSNSQRNTGGNVNLNENEGKQEFEVFSKNAFQDLQDSGVENLGRFFHEKEGLIVNPSEHNLNHFQFEVQSFSPPVFNKKINSEITRTQNPMQSLSSTYNQINALGNFNIFNSPPVILNSQEKEIKGTLFQQMSDRKSQSKFCFFKVLNL